MKPCSPSAWAVAATAEGPAKHSTLRSTTCSGHSSSDQIGVHSWQAADTQSWRLHCQRMYTERPAAH